MHLCVSLFLRSCERMYELGVREIKIMSLGEGSGIVN